MVLIKFVVFILALFGVGVWVLSSVRPRYNDQKHVIGLTNVWHVPIAIVILAVVSIMLSAINVIPAGSRGVVFSQVNGVQNRQLQEGFNLVTPFLESVTVVDVRVAKAQAEAPASTRDTQNVYVDVVVTYNPNPAKVNKLYQKFGDEETIRQRIIAPAIQEEVKASTPRYQAAEMIAKRHELKQAILKGLTQRLARSWLTVYDVTIQNIRFEADYARAIEEKAQQEQIAQKEELIIRQKEAVAKQKIAEAEGERQAKILRAQGEAEANRLLAQSITPEVLKIRYLDKWDGVLPKYMPGGDATMLLPAQ